MMRFILFYALTAILLLAPPAFAYDYTIEDNYWGADDNGYGDVIGESSLFGIDRMEVGFSGHESMTVKVYTPFEEDIADFGTLYGDLFISTDGWDPDGSADDNYETDNAGNGESWEYVFDTDAEKLFQINDDTVLTLAQDAPPQNGGSGYIVRDGQEVLYKSGGTEIDDDSSFDGASGSGDDRYLEYAIDLSSLDITGDPIGLKWSMTCANDSIEGSVPVPAPEPSTMLLLGSGLVGLAFYRRRKK